ncbi:hypothetical protein QL285_048205 [Trifolium repens]|nr:hypothetical protein QL285_048205 [Trifolium repens]
MASHSSNARQNHVPFPSLNKIASKDNASINRERGGNEMNGFIDGIFSSMSTFQMEFDVEVPRGRLPQCFVREFGDIVAPFMVLLAS